MRLSIWRSDCARLLARPSRIIAVLALLLLGGCSTVRFGYQHAPTVLYWWLDSYVDFNDTQAAQVRRSLAALYDWHRRQELPAYADLLAQLRQQAQGTVTPQQVCAAADRIHGRLQGLLEQSADGLARVVPTLAPAQLQELARQFDRRNENWRVDWLDGTADEQARHRLERLLDRFETFYGRLSDAQRAMVRQRLATSAFDARVAWSERLRRQQDMLRVFQDVRGDTDAPRVRAAMVALLRRSLDSPEPVYQRQLQRRREEGCQLVAVVHNSSNTAQRRHLHDLLQDWETDARALAAAP